MPRDDATGRRPPNILLITCHDLGRFLHCYGVPTVRTPHLDALAADGVLFTQAFCTAPQCSPARSSLFTGRYPHSNGVMGQADGSFGWDLYPQEQHLGQALRAAGYATALVGTHHESLRGRPEQVAARCGMETVEPPGRGQDVTDRALRRLAHYARQDLPFYLQVGYTEPHRLRARARDEPDYMGFIGDYLAPDDALGITVPAYLRDEPPAREELAELQGAVQYMDAAVGRLLDGLHDLGLAAQTLVLFTTDHGLAFPRAKCSLCDAGLEIALILRLPARGWGGGRRLPHLVSGVDVFPTLLDLAGGPVGEAVQGQSLLPLLDGEPWQPRDCVFGEQTYHSYYDPRRCIRTERYKLIVNFTAAFDFMDPTQSWRPRTCPVVPDQPMSTFHPVIELYDLATDPWERQSVADDPAYADAQRDLLARLSHWMRTTDDPLRRGPVASPMHDWAVAALEGARRTMG